MPEVRVESNIATVAVNYANAPRLVSSTIFARMNRIGQRLHGYVVRQKLRGGHETSLEYRTGTLSRAMFYRVEIVGTDEIVTRVGAALSKARYARIQEEGGTVTPKKGQYLTVPLEAARTAKGVARFTAHQLFENPASAGYVDAFIHNGVIFGVKERTKRVKGEKVTVGGFGSVVPLFALKRFITIKPHHYLRESLRENMPMIREELGLGLGEAAGEIGGQS